VAAALVAVLAGSALPRPAVAAPSRPAPSARTVAEAKTELARALARSLRDSTWSATVRAALRAGTVDPLALARGSRSRAAGDFLAVAEPANSAILAAKGLPATTGSVLDLRLATGSAGAIRFVAAEIGDDSVSSIPAYDQNGTNHPLSAAAAPSVPVAVIGVDEKRALTAGLAVLQAELTTRHVRLAAPPAKAAVTTGYWATRVMRVRLNDDEEPWFKGDAEIFSIVSGVGVTGQPQVDIVQMPYLDNDGTNYYPGQILVDWSHFAYNAVDAVMMEEDDGTNYRALAQALATALLAVIGGGTYAPMVDAILAAIPDSWWTDDPDYVDSWYLLTKQTTGTRVGARANGTIDFAPYFVTPV
jgi:hypothetical protein